MPHADSPSGRLRVAGPRAGRPGYPPPPAEHSLRPRLAAIAASAAEVVRFAGGWLFDQAMAGWDVNVLTADHGDLRPLRILGARAHDLDAVLAAPVVPGSCLQAIAVPAELYHREARIRQMVLHARSAEVRMWGDLQRLGETQPVRHPLSFAARAFKAHALAAVGVPAEAAADEVFCPLLLARAGTGGAPLPGTCTVSSLSVLRNRVPVSPVRPGRPYDVDVPAK